jgi:hypothetical protein
MATTPQFGLDVSTSAAPGTAREVIPAVTAGV